MDESKANGAPVAKRRARWALVGAIAWLAVGCAAVMGGLAAFWPDDLREAGALRTTLNYAAFMCATFAFHAGVAMVGVMGAAVLMRRRRLLVAGLLVGMVCAGPEVWWSVRRLAVRGTASDSITIMSTNVLGGRADPDRLNAEIVAHRPDIVVIQEWTNRAKQRLGPMLGAAFPHQVESIRERSSGQAVYSKRPFTAAARTATPSPIAEPQLTVTVELSGQELRVTNVHVPPPVSAVHRREQRHMTDLLATDMESASASRPHVIAGDFNAVSRSANLYRLRRAGFAESHRGAGAIGRGSTWPRLGALRWVPGIRLDHVLHSDELACESSAVCGDVGSDHAPVVARLRWAR